MRHVAGAGLLAFFASVTLAAGQQLDAVSTTLGSRLIETGRRNVAVVDFTDLQGNATELGRYLAEELSVTLAVPPGKPGTFTVVDRTHLKAILQEHKLGATGLIDSLTARKLGKLAGVDTLITGTLTPFGDSVRLTVKALDSETAGMVAATTANIPRTKAIDELLNRAVGAPASSQTSSTGQRGSGASTTGPPLQRVRGAGITLELVECRKSGACQLFVTAEEDTRFWIGRFNPTQAWDQTGNEYKARNIRIGNRDSRGDLVAGVRTPVTINLEFSGATRLADIDSLSAIQVNFSGVRGKSASVRFRDIPLK